VALGRVVGRGEAIEEAVRLGDSPARDDIAGAGGQQPLFGQNAELRVITAVVIGGASLQGGSGSIGRTLRGLCFLALLYNAFAMTGVSTYWQDVVTGFLVLASALATDLVTRRSAGA